MNGAPTCATCVKPLRANWSYRNERRMSGRGGMPSIWTVRVKDRLLGYGRNAQGKHCSKKCEGVNG